MTPSHVAKLAARLGDWALSIPDSRPPLADEKAALWIPAKLVTPNDRLNQWEKARRTRQHRYEVCAAWVRAGLPRGYKPKAVTLTRVGVKLMDDDNYIAMLKPTRDQVAEMCGFNDREKLWTYAQDTGADHGVRIEVWWT